MKRIRKDNLVIDEVVTYNHALSESEIEQLYSNSRKDSYIELSIEEGKALNSLIINHPEIKWWWFSKNALYLEINCEVWDDLWKI